MPETPLSQRLEENVVQALLGIKKHAGFFNDVSDVKPWRSSPYPQMPNGGVSMSVYCLVEESQNNPNEGGMPMESRLPELMVECEIQEDGPDRLKAQVHEVAADVYRALIEDTSRGGLAIDTRYGTKTAVPRGPGKALTQQRFYTPFRHFFGDPAVVGR